MTLESKTVFWEIVEGRAAATPDRIMAIDDRGRELSFAGYRDWCERAAAGLAERGLSAGDHVSWQLPNWLESLVLFGALARLGVVQNPIIPIYREREVGFVVAQTGARLLVVPSVWRGFDYQTMADKIAPEVLVCDAELPEGDPSTLTPFVAEDPQPVRWIYYTSGTTADPKGAEHVDSSIIAAARHIWENTELTEDDVWPLAFPFTHIGGSSILIATLVKGCQLLVVEHFDPAAASRFFAEHGLTIIGSGTPFFLAFLAEQRKQPDTPLFPKARIAIGGGSPRPNGLHYEVKNELGGMGIVSSYGLTEVPIVTYATPDDPDDKLDTTEGHFCSDTDWKLVDGEIRLKGPTLCRGYVDEALNAEAFDEDGYFKTGDLGEVDDDGYVTIVGRLKDVIIRKSENISAKQVEDLLFSHPKVADVAVIGLPDSETGERAVAVVQSTNPDHPITFLEMQQHCRDEGLMTQKIPEQLELVDEIPRNPSGKVLKQALRDTYKDTPFRRP